MFTIPAHCISLSTTPRVTSQSRTFSSPQWFGTNICGIKCLSEGKGNVKEEEWNVTKPSPITSLCSSTSEPNCAGLQPQPISFHTDTHFEVRGRDCKPWFHFEFSLAPKLLRKHTFLTYPNKVLHTHRTSRSQCLPAATLLFLLLHSCSLSLICLVDIPPPSGPKYVALQETINKAHGSTLKIPVWWNVWLPQV